MILGDLMWAGRPANRDATATNADLSPASTNNRMAASNVPRAVNGSPDMH